MNKIVIDKIYERYVSEYKVTDNEAKQELYIIVSAIVCNQINHIFNLKQKHLNIYLQHLGVYTNGEPLNISQISKNVGLVERSVKTVIKNVKEIEKKYISQQLSYIYAKNYEFNKINLINILDLTDLEKLLLLKIKAPTIENIICNEKEEFLSKILTYTEKNFNLSIETRKKLYEKIYILIYQLNLGFINELEDTNPLKEYLYLNNLITKNFNDIHKLDNSIRKLEKIKINLDNNKEIEKIQKNIQIIDSLKEQRYELNEEYYDRIKDIVKIQRNNNTKK